VFTVKQGNWKYKNAAKKPAVDYWPGRRCKWESGSHGCSVHPSGEHNAAAPPQLHLLISPPTYQAAQATYIGNTHRYLMSRLSLQVFYLWRHVLLTAPPFILWWSNLVILFAPLHRSSPFIRGLRCQAIQTEHGLYITERTQKAVYIVRCLWEYQLTFFGTATRRLLARMTSSTLFLLRFI
jgi:hypothetical protein